MESKQYDGLINLAKERLKKKLSKEEILTTFINAGILDSSGNFTKNFPYLRKYYKK